MTISRERLHAAACRLHAAAEHNHRVHGYAAPLLVFLPPDAPPALVLIPDGIPPQHVLDTLARDTDAVAIMTTAEAWVSRPGLTAQVMAQMPFEDLPRPADDPNHTEEIVTYAVGIGPDNTLISLLRTSWIQRTAVGTLVHDAADGVTGLHRDGATAALAAALTRAGRHDADPAPHGNQELATPAPAPSGDSAARGEHGGESLIACPSCHALTGELHADWCEIAWCAAVGLQRYGACNTAHGCRTDPRRDCRTPWTGLHPGFAECRELGWYAHLTTHGWASCDAATPGAIEDLNRLMTEGRWDPQQGRYLVPDGPETAESEARPPESGQHNGEGR
jgi:hypothetical protein